MITRGLKWVGGIAALLTGWLAVLAFVMVQSDSAPAALVLLPTAGFLNDLPDGRGDPVPERRFNHARHGSANTCAPSLLGGRVARAALRSQRMCPGFLSRYPFNNASIAWRTWGDSGRTFDPQVFTTSPSGPIRTLLKFQRGSNPIWLRRSR